ncbi:MAG: cytochrome c, partial [Verrucomicrobiota bacterium]
ETLPSTDEVHPTIDGLDLNEPLAVEPRKKVTPTAERGQTLVAKYACIACHSNEGGIGPPFKGLMGSMVPLVGGSRIRADRAYIRESILEPGKKVRQGYQVAMGSYAGVLSEEDIEAMIMYLETLR